MCAWSAGDRHLFCVEDPFELTHDLGRVMDRDTLRDVRSWETGPMHAMRTMPCAGCTRAPSHAYGRMRMHTQVRSEIDRADVLLSEQRGTFEKLTQRYEDKHKPEPPKAPPPPAPPPPPPLPTLPAAFPPLPTAP